MLTALWILFWVLVCVLILVVIIIVSPVHVMMTARSTPVRDFRVELRLFSARLPRLLAIDGAKLMANEPGPTPDKKKANGKPRTRKRRHRRNFAKFIPELPATLKKTLRGVHIDALQVRGEFGFDDPADTGTVFGLLAPLTYIPQSSRFSVMLAPNFDQPCANGSGKIALHFIPIRLSWPALSMAWRAFVWPR